MLALASGTATGEEPSQVVAREQLSGGRSARKILWQDPASKNKSRKRASLAWFVQSLAEPPLS